VLLHVCIVTSPTYISNNNNNNNNNGGNDDEWPE